MRGLRLYAALTVLFLLVQPCRARDLSMHVPDFPYAGQGPFVLFPAKFLSSPVTQVGYMAGELVCLPVSLAQGPEEHDHDASLVCGKALGIGLGWPVYAAVGLPFYVLKQAFWDLPATAVAVLRRPKSR